MKPAFQQVIDRGKGDCLRACVASLLELEIDRVPNFVEAPAGISSIEFANQWLALRGLALFQAAGLDSNVYSNWFALKDVYCIFSVPSQRFEGISHAVVGRIFLSESGVTTWEIVHDPNPSNQPYPDSVDIKRVSFVVKCC